VRSRGACDALVKDDASFNPYAPPAADEAPGIGDYDGPSLASQRFSTLALFAIAVVTLGLYMPVWLFFRRKFLDSLDCDTKIGIFLPVTVAGLLVAVAAMAGLKVDEKMVQVVQIASGITSIIAVFRVRRILRLAVRLNVSGLATFFFGALYLQYKINLAADQHATTREFGRARRLRERDEESLRAKIEIEPSHPDPEGERALRAMNASLAKDRDDE